MRVATVLALILSGIGVAVAQNGGSADPYAGPPKLLWFRIDLHRLVPSALTIPEGKYLFRINKGIVLSDVNLELQDGSSKAVQARASAKGSGAFTHLTISLHPGRYVLTVPDMPKWTCDLTVTPKK